MLSNRIKMRNLDRRGGWIIWRGAVPVLIALLMLGMFGMGTSMARSSVPLRPTTVSPQLADSSPALAIYNATLYVGWTGRNTAHNLNLMTYDQTSQTFGSTVVLTDTTLPGAGPSLTIFNGNLCVAWIGTDHRLNVGFFKPGNPTQLANKVTLSDTSYQAPSIATYNGRLYLSWRGTDGHLNIISSADASTFNTKVTYSTTITASPTLQTANAFLFVAWEDTSASSHLVFAQYNPSDPSVLNAVVTTTATSTFPIALFTAGVAAPDLRVVWRTATDAHIHLGIYEGDQTLHNEVTLSDTTSYGPALTMPYLGWTGTDAAQHVNVSQVNF